MPVKWRADISGGYSGPTVADGRVYVTDRITEPAQQEQVHCFDAAKGTVLWKKDLHTEYKIRLPIWGISSAPLIENNLLIVQIGGSDNACLVAFDKLTGKEIWRALPDKASYSAPIIIEQAGQRVLVCWTGERVVGIDPTNGKVHWHHPFAPTRMVINIATPVIQGDYIYGVDSYGELRCLDLKTGDRIWEDLTAVPKERWSNIHMVKNAGNIWMFNERGQVIISTLSPKGFHEISRTDLIEPTKGQLNHRGGVCWAHPAYAYKHIYIRNDNEILCASLAAKDKNK